MVAGSGSEEEEEEGAAAPGGDGGAVVTDMGVASSPASQAPAAGVSGAGSAAVEMRRLRGGEGGVREGRVCVHRRVFFPSLS